MLKNEHIGVRSNIFDYAEKKVKWSSAILFSETWSVNCLRRLQLVWNLETQQMFKLEIFSIKFLLNHKNIQTNF